MNLIKSRVEIIRKRGSSIASKGWIYNEDGTLDMYKENPSKGQVKQIFKRYDYKDGLLMSELIQKTGDCNFYEANTISHEYSDTFFKPELDKKNTVLHINKTKFNIVDKSIEFIEDDNHKVIIKYINDNISCELYDIHSNRILLEISYKETCSKENFISMVNHEYITLNNELYHIYTTTDADGVVIDNKETYIRNKLTNVVETIKINGTAFKQLSQKFYIYKDNKSLSKIILIDDSIMNIKSYVYDDDDKDKLIAIDDTRYYLDDMLIISSIKTEINYEYFDKID